MSGLSISDPIQFAYLAASPNVIPGDVVHLRGGDYVGNFNIGMGGTEANPVIVQPYAGETVNIIGGLSVVQGRYVTFKNLNIVQPDTTLSPVYIANTGVRFEDCNFEGGYIGVRWFGSGPGALLRCHIHACASYGLYSHNHNGGLREITDCVFDEIGGYYALHLYSESANNVQDYVFSGCALHAPCIVHAPYVHNVTFTNNDFYTWLKIGNGYSVSDTRQFVVSGNRFAGSGSGLTLLSWSEADVQNNTFQIVAHPTTGQRTNVYLLPGANILSTTIDNNLYYGSDFNLDNTLVDFTTWQGAGYDAQGNYIV